MKKKFKRTPRLIPTLAVALATTITVSSSLAGDATNGQLRQQESNLVAWQEATGSWVSVEQFWTNFATQHQGKYWGRSEEYPTYSDVKEHDTLLVEGADGPCLMYFFHNRWRRAQDVKRWDPRFNEALGCPQVFD